MKRISAFMIGMALFFASLYGPVTVSAEEEPEQTETRQDTETDTETETQPGIDITAPSAILMEASTGTVIYEKDADTARPPASVTKVMTMLWRRAAFSWKMR